MIYPGLIARVHEALAGLGGVGEISLGEPQKPEVSVRSSVRPDHIVCLEDGKKMKMLKRHLLTHHGVTPAEYRVKWGLSGDYPIVAPAYAEQCRSLAIESGLDLMADVASSRWRPAPKPKI